MRSMEIEASLGSRWYPERGRQRFSERVQAVLRAMGQEAFPDIARAVRDLYADQGKTPDAARRCLERAWRKVYPDEPMPSLPKGFWSTVWGNGIEFLRAQPSIVLPDKELATVSYLGSFSSFSTYLSGQRPFWLRSAHRQQ